MRHQNQPDSTLDVVDGSHAVQVTVMHRDSDSVLQVHQLRQGRQGRLSTPTRGALLGGGLALLAGVICLLPLGAPGLAALLLIAGSGLAVVGASRLRLELRSPHLLVGSGPGAHLPLEGAQRPLVLADETGFRLMEVEGLRGSVRLPNEHTERPLSDLFDSGALPIAAGTTLDLQLGPYSLQLGAEAPARKLKRCALVSPDRGARLCHSGSLAAHAVVLALALLLPPTARALSVESFELRSTWLPLEERRGPPLGAWIATRPTLTAEEGSGVRASGQEGKMGSPLARRRPALFALRGPKKNPDPRMSLKLAQEAAERSEVLRLLGRAAGGPLAAVFGKDSAVGYDTESAMGALVGGQHGEAYGVGGLGLIGTGRGGGGCGGGEGDDDCGFVGLGAMGTVGRGLGVGRGAGYGRGAGRLASYAAGSPVGVFVGSGNVRGSLDKALIRRVIRRHINEWKYCFQRELQASPSLGGRLEIRFVIGPKGQVLTASRGESTVGNAEVERCMVGAIRRWQFPAPHGGGVVQVRYPVIVRVAGG